MEIQIVKAGWLERQSRVLKRWKRNWFVLNRTGELMYFESQDSHHPEDRIVVCAALLGIWTGNECQFTPPDGRSKDCLLHLNMRQEDLRLCAESSDDMRAWQIALEEARVLPSSGTNPAPVVLPPGSTVMYPRTNPAQVVVPPGSTVMYPQSVPAYTGQVITPPGHYVVHNAATGHQQVVMGNQPGQVICVREPYHCDRYRYRGGLFMGPMLWW